LVAFTQAAIIIPQSRLPNTL